MSTKSGDTIGTPIMVRETEEAEWMRDVVSGICTRGCCVVDSHGRFHGPSSEGKYWQYALAVPETAKPIERLDSKVHGTLIKNKDGKEIPADEFIVFRPSDNALGATLVFYLGQCMTLGADKAQIEAVHGLLTRVHRWRAAHPDRCKVPDVEPGELSG